MFGIDDALLHEVAIAVGKFLIDRGLDLLKGDPEKQAFKVALAETLSELQKTRPQWVRDYFDSKFLADRGAPVLARSIMRDGPTAEDLARAYVDQFFGGAQRNPDLYAEAIPIAAEFLLLLDLALRRQKAFRPHFDSRALDRTADYLDELVRLSRAAWAEARMQFVLVSLGMLIEANELYASAGQTLAKGQEPVPRNVADARIARKKAFLNLGGIQYSERRRLELTFQDLVTRPYQTLEETGPNGNLQLSLRNLVNGSVQMDRLLSAAPPL